MMEYKGYIGRVALDDAAGLFHGEVINARDVVTFHGTSAEDIMREFRASIDVYLDFCAEQGKETRSPGRWAFGPGYRTGAANRDDPRGDARAEESGRLDP
ncbi:MULTISPECIES: toxin-antitoxin system HicB family antitoxin [unclassified Thiocapsa]|uniref:toxin-antitoxin system HicB family antitoxin n=1 Tax=unclassified Thiocapsa TaxID=2641286 RepID=UPI0035AD7B79